MPGPGPGTIPGPGFIDPASRGTGKRTFGSADPVDPPANVAAAPRTMPNALLVTVPGGSHHVASSGCLPAQSTAFILAGNPASKAGWAACTRELSRKLPPFPPAP